jgi:soluble lytic murein transglycosylase
VNSRPTNLSHGLARGTLLLGLLLGLGPWAHASPRLDLPPDSAQLSEREGPAADRVLRARSQALLSNPASALNAARQAIADRDRSHAVWLFEQVIERHPIVADHAAFLQARLLLEDGRSRWSARVAEAALARFPNSPIRADLFVQLGNARANQRDSEAALTAWRSALSESREGDLRASALLSIASLEERAGRDSDAATTYTLIWYAHPTTREAEIAAHRLELLEELLEQPLRDATDWRRRADRLYRKRQNEEALAAYERALELGLVGREAGRAQQQRAQTLFRLRRYPEAVKAFEELPQSSEIALWHARSLARADRVPEAIAEFEKMADGPSTRHSVRARYLAAVLLEGRSFADRADAHFRKVEAARRSGGLNEAAGWRLGWSAYRQGRYSEAVGYFDRLIKSKKRDPIGQLRARYWRARAWEEGGGGDAPAEFAAMATEFPLSYYGWRSRDRTQGVFAPKPASPSLAKGRKRLKPKDLLRPRILLEAGLNAEALGEVQRLARRVRGLDDRLDLAHLASDIGDYHLAHRIVVEGYSESLARGPIPRYEDLWWYAWPSAYLPLVRQATGLPGSVSPELVYSIMREESGFRASIVSPVGARGLLQIMIPTGEQLAIDHGVEDFEGEDLFDPSTNIDLGARYLAELEALFAGRTSASIASYNAGPEAVALWKGWDSTEDDEWVEAIPYSQTRSYVKRVLRSLYAYRVLY